MKIEVKAQDLLAFEGDTLIVNLFEGVERPDGATGAVDQALGGSITAAIRRKEFKGKLHERLLLHTTEPRSVTRVLVIGLGKQEECTLDRVRSASAEAMRHLRGVGAKTVGSIVHGAGIGGLQADQAACAVTEGALLGLYRFDKYQKPDDNGQKNIRTLTLLERDSAKIAAMREGVRRGRILAEAVSFARDLVNEPANTLTPSEMAARAKKMASGSGLTVKVLERADMKRLGMGALLGVAQGSHEPPKFIEVSYKGRKGKGVGPRLGLVGKGLTFDSGGISIKPSEGMEAMKGDMAGGATVLAAIKGIAELKLPVDVTAIVPATENLPSGTAQRPGDIVRAMNGKTIEVINTDAEGRLILADALCYACDKGLTHLVDVATLTGACVIALGSVRTGAFTNDAELMRQVKQASEAANEKIWELPMDEEYGEQIKSDCADMKNIGGRKAGPITGAKLLAHFVGKTPWVHLDIAGTAQTEKEYGYQVKGATGAMVRTLIYLAMGFGEAAKG
ncbi:Cytosol aminopeptidase [Candidatus Methylomirabilis lanthanidiphila]|uniref:Probable cytosol aminopeptidase n=1 Tax=Candidatus Methylomirabilis lanthanidiphila TaxID=2211376 RepID=A0A564ZKZ9_9BACT|nr:leucyl aminopeptidase [Candidatus Methylomirabilis lanthanidiphila]VUZ86001.1 Cytosol aminopeptidase [Candidatus Methylomirabilis lanthanidiphila]